MARVRFDGNGGPLSGHNDYQLRSQMDQGASSFGAMIWPLMYFAEGESLRREALDQDAYRLEVWYAHNGWFDARFHGWSIRQLRKPGKRRSGVVEVAGTVEAGEPSVFASFEIVGTDRTSKIFANTIRRTGYVQEGGQFNLDSVYTTRDQLIQTLHDHARAYARVSVEMTARAEDHEVDVLFRTEPGISTTYGEVRVEGQDIIHERVIRETLGFKQGQPYGVSDLARAQRRLFDLGTFAVVNVQPDLSDDTVAEVPITVRVHETKFQRLRVGGGLDYDGQTVTPRLSANYRHANLFNRLLRLDTGGAVGVAVGLNETEVQPIFNTSIALSTPRLFGPDWTLSLAGTVKQDLQNGQFAYLNPTAGLDLGWQPSEHVALGFGPNWELYQFLGLNDKLATKAVFGEDFHNPYQLFTMDARLSVDWRDDPIFTRRGSLYRVSARHALPVPGVDLDGNQVKGFHFTEVSLDARTYRPIRLRRRAEDMPWSYAARIQGRVLQPWNDRLIPYPERVFMGGATDVRGFRGQQMGHYDVLCLYESSRDGSFSTAPGAGLDVNRIELPRGGQVGASMTAELRYDWAYDITWAFFSDVGVLVEDFDGPAPGEASTPFHKMLRVSGGVGARYKSLIGPIRIDLAFRPLYAEDQGPLSYENCLSGHSNPRRYDLLGRWRDSVEAKSSSEDPRTIPVAVNLLLAIGEAL